MKMEIEVEPKPTVKRWTVYVYWANGDNVQPFERITGYSVSEGCLFLSAEWNPGLSAISGIPLSAIQFYEILEDAAEEVEL
mgnify:FL=1